MKIFRARSSLWSPPYPNIVPLNNDDLICHHFWHLFLCITFTFRSAQKYVVYRNAVYSWFSPKKTSFNVNYSGVFWSERIFWRILRMKAFESCVIDDTSWFSNKLLFEDECQVFLWEEIILVNIFCLWSFVLNHYLFALVSPSHIFSVTSSSSLVHLKSNMPWTSI